ncbi:MAG: tetratricopeptide repeat protein [Planctomycetes bacterium]|nr:tetratricopeptide repeat protein [Planctomycetota bacterium]
MDFSKQLQKAEEALARRQYDFAVGLFAQLLEIEPDLGDARAGLRRALRMRVEKEPGNKLLRKVGGAVPLGKARAFAKIGKHDAAARAFEEYLNLDPLDESANLELGNELEAAGHLRSARAVYEFVAEIAPRNPEGWKRAGAMLRRTGEPLKALESYERALSIDPRDQEALKARKDLAAETALARSALDSAGHSRERMRDQKQASDLERGRRLHLSEEELRAAVANLEQRYAEEPTSIELMLELSATHEKLRDYDAALELAERAASYRRDSYELACRVGDLASKALKRRIAKADAAGNRDEADRLERELASVEIEDWRRRVALRPAEAALRLELGRRLVKAGQTDAAISELQRAVDDARARQDALFLLGHCFQRKGILDLARQQYQRALEGQPAAGDRAKEILYNLGTIAESEGQNAEARSCYARIYEVDIGYKDVASKMTTLH